MYAVIKTGGKQYRVAADEILEIERLKGEAGDAIEFGEVLMIADGDTVDVGVAPRVGRHCRRRDRVAHPRTEAHRLQEAPPQALSPPQRPPPGFDGSAHHRDPDRRRQACEESRSRAGGRQEPRRLAPAPAQTEQASSAARRGHEQACRTSQAEEAPRAQSQGRGRSQRIRRIETWHTRKQAVHPATAAIRRAAVSASRCFGGETVVPGNIIIRQRGTKWHPGTGVGLGKDHTIFATVAGTVTFRAGRDDRKFVSVHPVKAAE